MEHWKVYITEIASFAMAGTTTANISVGPHCYTQGAWEPVNVDAAARTSAQELEVRVGGLVAGGKLHVLVGIGTRQNLNS